MLKAKRITAKPDQSVDLSSAALSARLIELRARRDACEERQGELSNERETMLLSGAADSKLAALRDEHLRLGMEVTDLHGAIRLAEIEQDKALARERVQSLEARSAQLKAETLPSLAGAYEDLIELVAKLTNEARHIGKVEQEISGFNERAMEAKRNDLRVFNEHRTKVSGRDASVVLPIRSKGESDEGYELRRSNAMAQAAHKPDKIRVAIEGLMPLLMNLAYPSPIQRKRHRLVEVITYTDAETGKIVDKYQDVDPSDRRPVIGPHGRPRATFEGNVDKYPIHRGMPVANA